MMANDNRQKEKAAIITRGRILFSGYKIQVAGYRLQEVRYWSATPLAGRFVDYGCRKFNLQFLLSNLQPPSEKN
jgi:hypothetical protein